MYRIDLEFDNTLPDEKINQYCKEIDLIFAGANIPCLASSFGKRSYGIIADECNLADGGLALIEIKDHPYLRRSICKGQWITDTETDDIVKELFQ